MFRHMYVCIITDTTNLCHFDFPKEFQSALHMTCTNELRNCDDCMHGLRTPNIWRHKTKKPVFCADVAGKICFGRTYKFGICFSAKQWSRFPHRVFVVRACWTHGNSYCHFISCWFHMVHRWTLVWIIKLKMYSKNTTTILWKRL